MISSDIPQSQIDAIPTRTWDTLENPLSVPVGAERELTDTNQVVKNSGVNGWQLFGSVKTTTLANLGSAQSAVAGTVVTISDYGGTIAVSDGVRWRLERLYSTWASLPSVSLVPVGTEASITDYGGAIAVAGVAGWVFVVPYAPTINPTLDLDFAKQKFKYYAGSSGLVETSAMSPLITFTRSSIATFFDAMGVMKQAAVDTPRIDYDPSSGECKGLLIEEPRTNLYARSTNLNWLNKTRASIIANSALAVDGTMTAITIIEDTSSTNNHYANTSFFSLSAGTYSYSVFLKAAGRRGKLYVETNPYTGSASAIFDLVNGVCISASSNAPELVGVLGKISQHNDGWYKCSLIFTASVAVSVPAYIILANSSNTDSYTGDGASGVLACCPQLEVGAFPTSYIPTPATFTGRASTATYLDANGVLQTAASGVARSAAYDYDADGVLRPIGLLLEGAATNLLLYSEQFDNAAWYKEATGVATPPVVTANYGVAPDGTTSADRIQFALNGGTVIGDRSTIAQPQTSVAGTTYTQSVWLKTADASTKVAQLSLGGENPKLVTVTGVWKRFSNTGVASNTVRNFRLELRGTTGTSDSADLLVWGAQQGAGNYPTSYIPTTSAQVTRAADTSTSAQATRAADNAAISGANFSQWYKQYEGTVLLESVNPTTYTIDSSSIGRGNAVISDSTDSNRIRIGNDGGTSLAIRKGGIDQSSQTVGTVSVGKHKLSLSYTSNNVNASIDGVNATVDTSASIPFMTQINIGKGAIAGGVWNGHIRSLRYFPKALLSTELQAMTA